MRTRIGTAVLATVLLAGSAAAQEHQHAPAPAEPAPQMGMMGMMAGSPAMILRLRGPLGLSAEQVQRLEAIEQRTGPLHEQHMQAAMRAMGEAEALLESDSPDLARSEAKLREAAEHHVQAHLAMVRASVEARGVLTPGQRSNLRFGMRMMREMMPDGAGMMGSGMMRQESPRRLKE